jgi:hypothetical protein
MSCVFVLFFHQRLVAFLRSRGAPYGLIRSQSSVGSLADGNASPSSSFDSPTEALSSSSSSSSASSSSPASPTQDWADGLVDDNDVEALDFVLNNIEVQ